MIRQWQSEFKSDEFLELYPRGIPKLFEALNNGILGGKGQSALHGQLLWGKINPNIGYLCVFSMMDMYADFSLLHYAGFEVANLAYLHALGMAIDRALADLSDAEAIVLDVRFNPGGHDAAGKVIASRFVDQKYLAFTKQAYDKNGFTTPQEISNEPDGKAHFSHQVLLLTSEATASAARSFCSFHDATAAGYPTGRGYSRRTLGYAADAPPQWLDNEHFQRSLHSRERSLLRKLRDTSTNRSYHVLLKRFLRETQM